MKKGQIVFSKKGRDKGKAFVVMHFDEPYVFLVDGKLRTLDKPKKKKVMHIQPTNSFANLATDGRALQDADIRKEITKYLAKISQPIG